MIPANFNYESPSTLNEALNLLSAHDDAKVLAGGHSLLPAMKLRLAQPAMLVDLGRVSGLSYIRDSGDKIAIGAMTTHAEVAGSKSRHARRFAGAGPSGGGLSCCFARARCGNRGQQPLRRAGHSGNQILQ